MLPRPYVAWRDVIHMVKVQNAGWDQIIAIKLFFCAYVIAAFQLREWKRNKCHLQKLDVRRFLSGPGTLTSLPQFPSSSFLHQR